MDLPKFDVEYERAITRNDRRGTLCSVSVKKFIV